ncbi:chemotaxis protein CheW [Estrella lausannensis]|uniref:Chemotaxis protein CheW n=1 Tax=Estrella lausannensis TaxID=483423 RepID=A0A0H5E7H7_9BACT|nr:chemotaxis protein CheW [Estrella lausannensis]CRX39295.1 Chemotaxis protein CheW [Estrella lausannensis]
MSQDKRSLILEERAEKLAKSLEEKKPENVADVLKFQLHQEIFAIEIRYVAEVCFLKEFTPLPCTPAFVYGLMNVRRQVFAIIDLAILFGSQKSTSHKPERVIILKGGNHSFAVCTTAILGVESIPFSLIQPPPPTIAESQSVYLKGITTEGVALLDGASLIDSRQLIVDEEIDG